MLRLNHLLVPVGRRYFSTVGPIPTTAKEARELAIDLEKREEKRRFESAANNRHVSARIETERKEARDLEFWARRVEGNHIYPNKVTNIKISYTLVNSDESQPIHVKSLVLENNTIIFEDNQKVPAKRVDDTIEISGLVIGSLVININDLRLLEPIFGGPGISHFQSGNFLVTFEATYQNWFPVTSKPDV